MSKTILQYLLLFIVLTLLQVLLFNNLVIFHTSVCFIFIYLIIRLPLSLSTNWLLTISFISGLAVDIFSDTPGVNSLAAVLLAVVKKPVMFLYVSKDDKTKDATPSIQTMGWSAYSKYLLTLSAIFCLLSFTIEFFNFADIRHILLMAGASTIFTFIILLCTDCIFESANAKRL